MALSVVQLRSGPAWPLGFIAVAANGTPAGLMSRVDANNTSSPAYSPGPGNAGSEYTIRFRSLWFYGIKPGSNNNGLVNNTGRVYINYNPLNASNNYNNNCNRADSGSIVGYVDPGSYFVLPQSLGDSNMQVSPYAYTIDADNDGDGAVVVGIQPQGN